MASFPAKTLAVLMQLSMLLLMICTSVLAADVEHVNWPAHPPALAPKSHGGRHHHPHPPRHPPHHPPTYPPTEPPALPPVRPPVHPPVKPPTKPPVYPPVKPPTKPPVYPPVKPPTKPPVYPPVKPPTKPPVYPPVKPPVYPPVKPPTKPPVYPPVKPPTKPPVYPPVKPPTKPPVEPPTKPPVYPPVQPPVYPKLVAVQGVVFCKSCKYPRVNTLWGAKPLARAVVKLVCLNTPFKPVVAYGRTDENGYFLIMPPKLTNAAAHTCKVSIVKSFSKKCDVPTNFNYGVRGAKLVPNRRRNPLGPKYVLYNVGPFAFQPSAKIPCRR